MRALALLAAGLLLFSAAAAAAEPGFTRFERAVGASAKERLLAAYGGEAQLPLHDYLRVKAIFDRLTAVANSGEYSLTILDSYEINAFSLPGGYIFVTKGLLRLAGGDDQRLAGALAHEIAHVVNKHGINALLRRLGLGVLVEVGKHVLEVPTTQEVHVATQALIDVVQSGYNRDAELEADQTAQQYMAMAGFDPTGIIHLLSDLEELPPSQEVGAVFKTHPDPGLRIEQLLAAVGDYWPAPQRITEEEPAVDQNRTDPLNRFLIVNRVHDGDSPQRLYTLYDQQNQEYVDWLKDLAVNDIAFAPGGVLIAGAVLERGKGNIWFWNRQGSVVECWNMGHSGQISGLYFDPNGTRLAYQVMGGDTPEIWIGYLGEITRLRLSLEINARIVRWEESGIVLRDSGGDYYRLAAPKYEPIKLSEPIPMVIERKQRLAPQAGQDVLEGFSLTAPGSPGL
ncbi:MAG: M48 family metalloprotease [Limnochordia bacterium]|nr:M48 family metalloprotease [Bacillota bacterium]HOB08820.1 M48 family metalloprotease [Limnochordia bacterium]NLH30981.1 M48 family metalloprotease [Bacillota bacterium]HPT92380.1 M48 family metalloprotease [Limnochordia bacterium]HQD71395.1 M48 family metalloprotease [Limnochordia bacterium]